MTTRKTRERKDVEYYMSLPYAVEVRQYEDGTWFARMPELRGCMTEADTLDELMEMIRDAQRAWIEACLEDGTPIPEPQHPDTYSGQFRLRLPRSLHRELAERAEQEGTSLNQMVVAMLSRAAGATGSSRGTQRRIVRGGRTGKAAQRA
ncbi:MAG: type II toxin-antitoxin system HicB family antitoxin [Armatimonadota bacterium]